MKAVIMAGGMGTRLKAVTGDKPKPMAELLGKPIMEHIVLHLRACGFEDICAAVKYRAGDIMAHFGDGSRLGVKMQYRVEEQALGTAGGVKNCRDFYGGEDFLVISGDAACDFDLARLMAEHKNQNAAVTIALYKNPEPLRYGLALSDNAGRIRAFIEKPDWSRVVTDYVNTGIYVISPRVMELVPEDRSYDFGKELFPELLRRGEKLVGVNMEGYWCDIGTPLSYYRCCADAIEGRLKIELPEGMRPEESDTGEERRDEGLTAELPCKSRAELMRVLSGELMELGADYSDGIRLSGRSYELHIRPSASLSALRIAVKSADAEFARELLDSAWAAAEALEL